MQLILVERLNPTSSPSKSKPLWLVWVGQSMPPLERIWRKYLRRESGWSLVSLFEAATTLDSSSTGYSPSMWTVEWFNAHLNLGVMVSQRFSRPVSSPMAKTYSKFDSWKGRSVDFITFTPWLVHRLWLQNSVESLPVGLRRTSVLKEHVIPWSKKVNYDTKNRQKKSLNL